MNPINKECILLGKYHPELTTNDITNIYKLRKLALRYHRYCERYCNEDGFNVKLIGQTENKIKVCVGDFSVGFNIFLEEIQCDPRGWGVKTNNHFLNCLINQR